MRKKDYHLRDMLLACARSIATEEGHDAINIRSIAKRAGIATGTVYNYFSSKEEILLALTEDFWIATLAEMRSAVSAATFVTQFAQMYTFLCEKMDVSGARLMGSLQQVAPAGRKRMHSMQQTLHKVIVDLLEQDGQIRPEIWTNSFTPTQYADFILMNLVLLLQHGQRDIPFFLELITRTLYL